jgi:hypothetical protein
VLLEHNKEAVLAQWNDIMPALLDALTSTSDAVVKQARRCCLDRNATCTSSC